MTIYLNNIGELLRGTFYPKFIPKCNVKNFSVAGWKISLLNAGSTPGKQVIIRRLIDNQEKAISFSDLNQKFLLEQNYIQFVKMHHYKIVKKVDNSLYFEPYIFTP